VFLFSVKNRPFLFLINITRKTFNIIKFISLLKVAETRLGAKVLAKVLGLQNWRQILKFKQLGENLLDLLDSAKEQLHPEPYTRDEVCELLGLSDAELSDECLTENTRQLTSFQLRDRAVHVFSEAARVYEFKSVCDKAAAGDNSEVWC